MNWTLRKTALGLIAVTAGFALFYIFFTQKKTVNRSDALNTEILQEYHKLYLKLESSDYYASPVFSSINLFVLNSVSKKIAECFEVITTFEDCTNDFELTRYAEENHSFPFAYNAALNETLKLIFQNRLKNTDKELLSIQERLLKKIKSYDNPDKATIEKSEEAGNRVANAIFKKLMPEKYYKDYMEITKDSIYIANSCNGFANYYTENWVRSPLKYASYIGNHFFDDLYKMDYFDDISITESEKYREATEVMALSNPLSKENKWIAEFWSDDHPGVTFTPVTRWFSILHQIIEKEKLPFDKAMECYYLLSLGVYETTVQTWILKYRFLEERPSVYIKRNISKYWEPFHPNPHFPSYPSGHSAFGACAYKILEHYFGSNYAFTDNSHKGQKAFMGEPRSFNSLEEMAIENANSRLYLGVHYRKDCEAGFKLGVTVADKILSIYKNKAAT
jgi:hypothetical protein